MIVFCPTQAAFSVFVFLPMIGGVALEGSLVFQNDMVYRVLDYLEAAQNVLSVAFNPYSLLDMNP